jgi:phosphatidylserine/phosphatidylglycerophosphate/cardiolipin synthase-like enzyme
MRNRKQKNGITVNAIAGTYVVFLGLDIDSNSKKGFRGFAIKRKDHNEGEESWLRGLKTFEATEPHPAPGETFSSLKHPIQGFQWADYSAKPGYTYTYTIVCMYGDPSNLDPRRSVEIEVKTEEETGPTHSVFFNRGSVATQEYARKFLNKKPEEAGRGAYEWLSRGLLEALIQFIGRAGHGWSIHGAIYEFQYGTTNDAQYDDVLQALKEAHNRGATVKILYDDVETYDKNGKPDGPWDPNRKAVSDAKIKGLCKGRANAKLMHNKFLVLSRGNKNIAVWTGSTNLTENGIFGHSNLGHIVEDSDVADAFKAYWDRLHDDPEIATEYREANMENSPVPQNLGNGTTAIFSPRNTSLDALNWYAQLAGGANEALFMTFAFGMHELFKDVYRNDDSILRMALMEKAFASPKVKDRDEKDIQQIRNRPNVIVAIGNRIKTNAFDRWLAEIDRIVRQLHVYWIHTKYMLVDPLGDEPIVVSGSANFSKASTDTNDENMLIIKGDKRIADIYFGEYMRLFSHYSFREAVKWAKEHEDVDPKEWTPQFLKEEDFWMDDYFEEKGKQPDRFYRRKYFSGPLAL